MKHWLYVRTRISLLWHADPEAAEVILGWLAASSALIYLSGRQPFAVAHEAFIIVYGIPLVGVLQMLVPLSDFFRLRKQLAFANALMSLLIVQAVMWRGLWSTFLGMTFTTLVFGNGWVFLRLTIRMIRIERRAEQRSERG